MATVRPSADERRKSAAKHLDELDKADRHIVLGTLNHTFEQRTEFNQQMHGLLDDSSRDLDQIGLKLQAMREMVAGLRSQLVASQNATSATWDEVKEGLTKGHSKIQDGFWSARQWANKVSP